MHVEVLRPIGPWGRPLHTEKGYLLEGQAPCPRISSTVRQSLHLCFMALMECHGAWQAPGPIPGYGGRGGGLRLHAWAIAAEALLFWLKTLGGEGAALSESDAWKWGRLHETWSHADRTHGSFFSVCQSCALSTFVCPTLALSTVCIFSL